jgi:hypothetical protein
MPDFNKFDLCKNSIGLEGHQQQRWQNARGRWGCLEKGPRFICLCVSIWSCPYFIAPHVAIFLVKKKHGRKSISLNPQGINLFF